MPEADRVKRSPLLSPGRILTGSLHWADFHVPERRELRDPSSPSDHDRDPFAIDGDVPHPARIQNYLAGGDDNFAADRDVADRMSQALPGGIKTAQAAVRTLGAFVGRSVRFLAGEAGVRQFLNVGVAIPSARNVHNVAQMAAPDARVVYVGNDPVALAKSHCLQVGSDEGATAYLHGSLRDPPLILRQAADTLDLTLPVGVILPTTLNFVPDGDDPHGLVARLLKGVPSGSYLVIAHAGDDLEAEGMPEASARLSEALREAWSPRGHAEIARFFDGLDLVSPGLVPIDTWRPTAVAPTPSPPTRLTPIYAAVAHKP